MNKMRLHIFRRSISLLLLIAILCLSVFSISAATTSEIQKELDRLEEEAKQIAEEQEALEAEISANRAQAIGYADRKMQIDRDLELSRLEIENLTAQIHQQNMLIAEKQAELDSLQDEQDALLERYKLRIRAIQERGEVSYLSVLLQSDSFSDMLVYRTMIEEISNSDMRMLDDLKQSAAIVLAAKNELTGAKSSLEGKKAELADAQEALDVQRAEADVVLAELAEQKELLLEAALQAEQEVAALNDEIAKKEQEYTEAKRAEEAQNGTYLPPSETGFIFPVSLNGYAYMTSPYGYRTHPITGNYTLHNGVDLAANSGTPIFASKSGTVTTASNGYGWGNYVVINHGDGFSTLYAHQTRYAVSVGQYVTQGEVIGYVGSTGNSTGPHLHFTVYYNGTTVNPLGYITLP